MKKRKQADYIAYASFYRQIAYWREEATEARKDNKALRKQNASMARDREAVICFMGKDAWDRVTGRGER